MLDADANQKGREDRDGWSWCASARRVFSAILPAADAGWHHAVHVTLRTGSGVPGMRRQRAIAALEESFGAARLRLGMRLVHYSVQGNHLHLLVEAEDRASLARAMQGLAIRLAKALNRLFARAGPVWADRYHAHVLRSRREARSAVRYLLGNFARHARAWGQRARPFADAFSSIRFLGLAAPDAPVAAPRTWLLRTGWRDPPL